MENSKLPPPPGGPPIDQPGVARLRSGGLWGVLGYAWQGPGVSRLQHPYYRVMKNELNLDKSRLRRGW